LKRNENKKQQIFFVVENGTLVDVPLIESEEDFWNIIRRFQNGILAGNDLLVSTLPQPTTTIDEDQSKDLLDFNRIRNSVQLDSSSSNYENKRKSIEFDLGKYFRKKSFY